MAILGSDVPKVIRDSGCGWVIPPGNPKKLAEHIVEISKLSKNELSKRGEAGMEFARRQYSKSANLPKVIEILENAAEKGRNDTANEAG